jgi:hypothetical protein
MCYNNPNFLENQGDPSASLTGINIAIIALTVLSLLFLLMAAGTEPGIIPRHIDVLMESIPPAYREMAERQENKMRYVINKQ